MNHLLGAEPLSRFEPGAIGWTVLGIIGALTVFALVMVCIKGWRDNFGRTPPVDVDLEELREQLRGLAPSEKVDLLIDKIANAATRDEVEQVRQSLKGYVDQEQMDRRMMEVKELLARVEKDLSQQIKDLRGYLHDDVHEFRKSAQATWANAELQREGMHSRMNVFAETLFEIRGFIRAQKGDPIA